MDIQVQCRFKHIPLKRDGEQIATNLKTFVNPKVFDESGIKNCGKGGNDTIDFKVTRKEVNEIRNKLAQVLPSDNSPVWFSILSDPLHALISRSLMTTDDIRHEGSRFSVSCQFGSLRSYNQFYSHVPFDNKIVEVSFKPGGSIPNSLYIEYDDIRLVIPFDSIQKRNILVNKENANNGVYVLLSLKYLPNIYQLVSVKNENEIDENSDKKQVRLCADERNVAFIQEIAHCSDVVFHFPPSPDMPWLFLSHFLISDPNLYEINFSCFKISDWSTENNKNRRPDPFNYKNASFQDRYSLQMLISLGYVFRDKWAQLTDQELNWNKWDINERDTLCCFALEQLRKDHGYDLIRTENDYNETRKKSKKSNNDLEEKAMLVDDRQRLKVAFCTLTPLRIIFQPFEVTTGSRALRNPVFGGVERFLLVHLRDEDNRLLRVSNKSIERRVRNSMQNGIELFNKKYIYMGASTGQMKEMAYWFMDLPPSIKNITEAHKKLGSVEEIKNIATYIARVGQYFSSTWPINIRLTEVKHKNAIRPNGESNYVLRIDDIERNKYCFTDGVGKISWGLAGRVAQKMNIPIFCQEDIPSAFQIRVAGCKGMVAIDPESTLNDYYIHVRSSMIKFESDDWNLEICEYARPMPLTLNNQVIRLLSDLGNPVSAFINLQNRGFTQWEVPEEQQPSSIDIGVQKNISYSLSKDNLLTNRIPIPPTDGRNLFGIADETGELEYGQCFIQYSTLNSTTKGQQKFHVITGTVIVTKNPCLWPGDFRRLTAVRNDKLEECMRDVIVFPTKGERPHSNEISGSDLDGDQYWVYWGDSLNIEKTTNPLSYSGAKKLEVPSITPEIIIEHIIKSFGASIILGMIANTHTVAADKHPEHSFSGDCKKLAELFSFAVDSPKTGQFIDMQQIRPFQKKYCQDWPEYMRKYAERTYISTSALQVLFTKAKDNYFKWRENPIINRFPQRMKAIKGASANDIKDEGFKKWIDGGIYQEDANRKKPPRRKKPNKLNKDDSSSDETSTPPPILTNSTKSSIKSDENSQPEIKKRTRKPPQDKLNRPETPVTVTPATNLKLKKSSETENASSLINSSVSPPSASSSITSLSSLATPNIGECRPDFLMAVDMNITDASVVEFSSIGKNFYVVNTKKEINENPDRESIKNKLKLYMGKQDVFKKKPSTYKEIIHGPLYLTVFYGHIYFIEQNVFPNKVGDLKNFIQENSNQFIRFNYANIDELNIRDTTSYSTTKKNRIDYEFDCRVASSSSEYFTLLHDKNKTLRQIRVSHVWTKCFVRQPNFNVDSLYEIRSVMTHDLDSPEFSRIRNLVFNSQSTALLSGHKQNIKIDRSIFHSSIAPIGLKIIEEDQQTHIDQPTIESFYRKVRYVSIDEQQEKPKVALTMEYHVSPINKNENVLENVCDFAFAPTEKVSSMRTDSASSTTWSISSSLLGFSPYYH
ncbi:unnamed protein product [Rotaria sp. Silwood2]|nr:unnamed protein product [Rotaria sp. Silwood2]CAF4400634.1 unnamed protein product [Rotaria sp. Silwood2]